MRLFRKLDLWVIALAIACQSAAASEPIDRGRATIESYDSAISLEPNNSTLYAQRGAAHSKMNESDLALADFEKSIELDPDNPLPYRFRAEYWSNQRETNYALRDFDEAIQRDPDHAATYAQRGLHRALKHHWEESLADFDKAVELEPGNADLYFNRALLLSAQNDRHGAIEDLETAIQLNPDDTLAYLFRGWQWLMVGNLSQSIEDYSEVIKLDPHNCGAFLHRAIGRMQQREYAKALADLTAVDDLDRRAVDPRHVIYVAGELLRAMNLKLSKISPESEDDDVRTAAAHRDRGIACRALERWTDALKELNEAIRRDRSSSLAFAARGQLWLREHQWDRAIEDFDVALQLNPREARVWIDRGTAHAEKNEWALACEDFTQAIQIDPRGYRALAKRGAAWQAQGNMELAIADYEQVMRGTPFYIHAAVSGWNHEAPAATPSTSDESSQPNIAQSDDDDRSNFSSTGGLQLSMSGESAYITKMSDIKEGQASSELPPKLEAAKTAPNDRRWRAVSLHPDYLIVFMNHARCMGQKRDWEQALKDYQELTCLAPYDAQAFRHMAWLKATCPDARFRDGEEAVRLGQQAVERGHSVEDLVALSAACAEQGAFVQAIEHLVRASELAAEQSEKELQTRRQQYKAAEFEQLVEEEDRTKANDKTNDIEAAVNACQQSQWKDARAIGALAEIYAAAEQFDAAIDCCEKQYALLLAERDKPLEELLKLYTEAQPYRTENCRLIERHATAGIVAKLEAISDEDDALCIGGLPARQLTIAQIRLISFLPKDEQPAVKTMHEGEMTEKVDQTEESVDSRQFSGRVRTTKEAAQLVTRGSNRQRQGEFEKALEDFRTAIQLDSRNVRAYYNIARMLATCTDDQYRNGKEAVQYAQTGCELTDWKDWNFLDTLAAAYAENKDFASAIRWTEAAIELVPFDEPDSVAERLQQNLNKYRENSPIRE